MANLDDYAQVSDEELKAGIKVPPHHKEYFTVRDGKPTTFELNGLSIPLDLNMPRKQKIVVWCFAVWAWKQEASQYGADGSANPENNPAQIVHRQECLKRSEAWDIWRDSIDMKRPLEAGWQEEKS